MPLQRVPKTNACCSSPASPLTLNMEYREGLYTSWILDLFHFFRRKPRPPPAGGSCTATAAVHRSMTR